MYLPSMLLLVISYTTKYITQYWYIYINTSLYVKFRIQSEIQLKLYWWYYIAVLLYSIYIYNIATLWFVRLVSADNSRFKGGSASFAAKNHQQQQVNLSCYGYEQQQQHRHQSSHQRRNFTATPYDATTLGGGVSVVASSWIHDSEEKFV